MFLTAVGEREMLDIISKCKNKRPADCDGIGMTIIKRVIEEIIQPLTYICNLSFQVSKFPEKMKIAKVIALYKSGDRHRFTNYRPVSLLPQFSKIFEKLFVGRLDTCNNKQRMNERTCTIALLAHRCCYVATCGYRRAN